MAAREAVRWAERDIATLAKSWARANGYEGRGGGWVARKGERRCICQGWYAFALRKAARIIAAGRPATGRAVQAGYDALLARIGQRVEAQLRMLPRF